MNDEGLELPFGLCVEKGGRFDGSPAGTEVCHSYFHAQIAELVFGDEVDLIPPIFSLI